MLCDQADPNEAPMRSFDQKVAVVLLRCTPEGSGQTSKFHVHVALHAELPVEPLVFRDETRCRLDFGGQTSIFHDQIVRDPWFHIDATPFALCQAADDTFGGTVERSLTTSKISRTT